MGTQITPVGDVDQEFIVREAAEAILKGDVVTYLATFADDTSDPILTVEKIDVDESVNTAVGVALEAAAAGEQVKICVSGTAEVLIDGTADVAIGDPLIASAGTAGELILHAAATEAEPTFTEAAATSGKIVPLDAQATDDGTLTWCLVACR